MHDKNLCLLCMALAFDLMTFAEMIRCTAEVIINQHLSHIYYRYIRRDIKIVAHVSPPICMHTLFKSSQTLTNCYRITFLPLLSAHIWPYSFLWIGIIFWAITFLEAGFFRFILFLWSCWGFFASKLFFFSCLGPYHLSYFYTRKVFVTCDSFVAFIIHIWISR